MGPHDITAAPPHYARSMQRWRRKAALLPPAKRPSSARTETGRPQTAL
jgi:hypothetical protein